MPGSTQPFIVTRRCRRFRAALRPMQGVVEVVIDERGASRTRHAASVDPIYDTLALAASRTWSYRPATRDGVPVKFRKLVQVQDLVTKGVS